MRRYSETETADDLLFCLLDFGIAKPFLKTKNTEQTCDPSPASDRSESGRGFRGTTTYASVAAHSNQAQGAKDDLWSMIFVFIDLVTGHLPWTAAARNWQSHKRKRRNERAKELDSSLNNTNKIASDDENHDKKRRVNNENMEDNEEVVGSLPEAVESGTFKDDVFAMKKNYTSVIAIESDAGDQQEQLECSDDAPLTAWVVNMLRAKASPSFSFQEEEVLVLKNSLNTIISHLQVVSHYLLLFWLDHLSGAFC